MYGFLIAIGVMLLIFVVLGLWVMGIYNALVRLRERCKNGFAQIDVQLKRRHDLIPNLVETVKGYMGHERETLEAVMQARASATQAQIRVDGDPTKGAEMKQLAQAEGMLTGALGRLMAVAEAYPDLKANQNMMQLSSQLTGTEDKIAYARQSYNDGILQYNQYKKSFPPVLLANMFGFEDATYFEIEEAQHREVPKVSF